MCMYKLYKKNINTKTGGNRTHFKMSLNYKKFQIKTITFIN